MFVFSFVQTVFCMGVHPWVGWLGRLFWKININFLQIEKSSIQKVCTWLLPLGRLSLNTQTPNRNSLNIPTESPYFWLQMNQGPLWFCHALRHDRELKEEIRCHYRSFSWGTLCILSAILMFEVSLPDFFPLTEKTREDNMFHNMLLHPRLFKAEWVFCNFCR